MFHHCFLICITSGVYESSLSIMVYFHNGLNVVIHQASSLMIIFLLIS
uniref:Uncharacterized protein n=1 Tax=Arundo donax TaxID=35708 RepID=A0A0A8YTP9_ARUDO